MLRAALVSRGPSGQGWGAGVGCAFGDEVMNEQVQSRLGESPRSGRGPAGRLVVGLSRGRGCEGEGGSLMASRQVVG